MPIRCIVALMISGQRLRLIGCGLDRWRSTVCPLNRRRSSIACWNWRGSNRAIFIYDIGSGDGAIIIRAAKKYGVKGVGIEIDQDLVRKRATMRFGKMSSILSNFAPRMRSPSMFPRRRW